MDLEAIQHGIVAALCAFSVGFACTAILMPLAIEYGAKLGIIDAPGKRRIHLAPTPRTGGFAVVLGVLLAVLLLFNLPGVLPRRVADQAVGLLQLWPIIISGSLIAATVGILDDIYQLRPLYKLAGQFFAAAIVAHLGLRITYLFGFELPPGADFVVTVAWYLFITNTYNLIDGLDGLAGGLGAITALGLAGTLMARGLYAESLVTLAFVGSLLAFLRYNWHPARVFLGDGGSNFIGFFLAVMALHSGAKATTFLYSAVPLLALSIPMLDGVLAIWRRSARMTLRLLLQGRIGSGIFSGDIEHLHHRLLRTGLAHRDVTGILYLVNALMVLVGMVALQLPQAYAVLLVTVIIILAALFIRFVPVIEIWDSALAIIHMLGRPVRPLLALVVYSFLDFSSLILSLFCSVQLSHERFFIGWFGTFKGWCVYPLVALLAAEVICRATRRRRARRFQILGLSLGIGTAIGILRWRLFHPAEPLDLLIQQGVLFYACATLCIVGVRFLPEAIDQIIAQHAQRTLHHGSGERAIALIPPDIDDAFIRTTNTCLQSSILVRRLQELPELLLHHTIKEIQLLFDLPEDQEDELRIIAKRYNIPVTRLSNHSLTLQNSDRA